MNRFFTGILVVLLVVTLAAACAPQASGTATPQPQATAPATTVPRPAQTVAPNARPAWQTKWDTVLAGAKKEGAVVVANTAGSDMRAIVAKGIKDAYGLEVESITGRAAEVEAKIAAERRAGLRLEDVFLGSTATTGNLLKPAGMLTPLDDKLILPEVNDPSVWFNGQFPWFDPDHVGFAFSIYPGRAIAINTQLVKPGDIKSWRDLLDPRWKGKMVLNDPTTGGAGQLSMVAMDRIMGWDYVKELAKAEPMIMSDQRQQMDWLAHGKISILIAPKPDTFAEFLKLGAPVAIVEPSEGTWLSCGVGAIAMFNSTAHPNAATVFINWLLGKQGQTLFANAVLQQSARLDVPTDTLPQDLIRQPGKKYTPVYDEAGLARRLTTDKLAKELFTPLISK